MQKKLLTFLLTSLITIHGLYAMEEDEHPPLTSQRSFSHQVRSNDSSDLLPNYNQRSYSGGTNMKEESTEVPECNESKHTKEKIYNLGTYKTTINATEHYNPLLERSPSNETSHTKYSYTFEKSESSSNMQSENNDHLNTIIHNFLFKKNGFNSLQKESLRNDLEETLKKEGYKVTEIKFSNNDPTSNNEDVLYITDVTYEKIHTIIEEK